MNSTLYAITDTVTGHCSDTAPVSIKDDSVAVTAQSYQSVSARQFYHRVVPGVLRDAQT